MSEQLPRRQASRFRSFCQAWVPTRRGILSRNWNGHRCRIGYEPGGHWASLDGSLLPGSFPTGNDALRTLFKAADAEPELPHLVVGGRHV